MKGPALLRAGGGAAASGTTPPPPGGGGAAEKLNIGGVGAGCYMQTGHLGLEWELVAMKTEMWLQSQPSHQPYQLWTASNKLRSHVCNAYF